MDNKLELNLDGTLVTLQIEDYKKRDWCNCTMRVHSDFISYDLCDDETFESDEIDIMITWFKKLLSGEIEEIEELEFTEPFVEFQLYPATEDCDVSADWSFCLWYDEETRKQVFTNNYLILDMDRDDIEMLVKYLESLSD